MEVRTEHLYLLLNEYTMACDFSGYDKTINYLYSLQKHGIKLGLSNTQAFMHLLGEPHRSFRSVHIAGTNGKGSTAAALASILSESGLTVGLFTSPHLVSFTERISVDNRRITEPEVIELASRVRSSIDNRELNPTFFEFVTAMAFVYFRDKKVDWAVVETGMGGRLDATNVIHPETAIITNISRDHCEFLGDTISDITFEKAGIIKHNVPVITASRAPDVIRQLKEIAESRDAVVHIYDADFRGVLSRMDERGIVLDYEGFAHYEALKAPLSGNFQLYNICSAVRTCEVLQQKGLHISERAIRTGLKKVHLEGRLEWVSREPPIILDGAHNPEAAASLAESIKKIFPGKKIILIVGIMGDKDLQGTLNPVINIAEQVILTKASYERAASPENLKKMMSAMGSSGDSIPPVSVSSTNSVSEALHRAKSLCKTDHVILVTGSFYTTGEVKELFGSDNVLSTLREYK
jgi:dihydrofolate synthase/folylpolyglutamate synthase